MSATLVSEAEDWLRWSADVPPTLLKNTHTPIHRRRRQFLYVAVPCQSITGIPDAFAVVCEDRSNFVNWRDRGGCI